MSPRWQITAAYIVALLVTVAVAKTISLILANATWQERLGFFFLAPSLSIDTWRKTRQAQPGESLWILAQAAIALVTLGAIYWWLPPALSQPWISWTVRAYCAVLPLWLLIQTIGLVVTLPLLVVGIVIHPIYNAPWRSRSLADFWGHRWNRHFGDWFKQVCFAPLRRRPWLGLWAAFLVSGVMHEWLVNLPFWLVFGRNLFGTMLLYFLIQAAGIAVERTWLRSYPIANRLFAWLVVIGPAPLVLNESTLRIFQVAH